ncbi:hypothetical protein ACQCR9_24025 [Ralstonia pseudosolanacearum]|uniref:hypothetical protein n=1 Tax=Ralstonia pseudosolanacearum TaxID=1310165 RepID=UPI003CE9E239
MTSAGAMRIDAGTLFNDKSQIIAAGTQLQFQQQNGVWLLSGVEPVPGSPC